MAGVVSCACTCLSNVPIFGAEYTLSQGVSPGAGVIRCHPSGNLVDYNGNLNMAVNGDFVSIPIVFTDPQAAADTGGQEVLFGFYDIRYYWQFGEIVGHWNIRRPDGTLDPDTEKTPQELANLLCEKIKPLYAWNVDNLPNGPRPEVLWDHANPANALASLCDQLNCVPVWWIDGSIKIWQKSVGNTLNPDLPSEARTIAFTIKPRPDSIKLVGGPNLIQVRIPLEAVGRDVDLTWQPIDDLSYAPSGGWGNTPLNFHNISDAQVRMPDGSFSSQRELAASSVFRCYRVQEDLQDVFGPILQDGKEYKRRHVLPLRSSLAEQFSDGDGSKHEKPGFVGGVFYHDSMSDYRNSPEGTKLEFPYPFSQIGFTVDARDGVVIFSEPIQKIGDTQGEMLPADLWFYVAATLQDPETFVPYRYYNEVGTGGSLGTGPKIVTQDDVFVKVVAAYDDDDHPLEPTDVTVNNNEVDQEAFYYLLAAAAAYDRPDSASDQIPWIVPYQLDGAIQQVTWRVDCPTPGATTIVSRGTQHDLNVLNYKDRRKVENTWSDSKWKEFDKAFDQFKRLES